jgi:hypothetical protein
MSLIRQLWDYREADFSGTKSNRMFLSQSILHLHAVVQAQGLSATKPKSVVNTGKLPGCRSHVSCRCMAPHAARDLPSSPTGP